MRKQIALLSLVVAICLLAPAVGVAATRITICGWRPEDAVVWTSKIIPAFEAQNPGITVDFQPYKNTEYDTIVRTSLQGRMGPDIVQVRPYGAYRSLYEAGYLTRLDDKIQSLRAFPEDSLCAFAASKGEHIYAVPATKNVTAVFYNKSIFDKHYLAVPATAAEFTKLLTGLKAKGVVPFAVGSRDGWTLSLMHSVFGPNVYGGDKFVADLVSGKATLRSKEFVDSISALKDLSPYFPPNYTGVSYEDTRVMFLNGMAAMFIGGSYEVGYFLDKNPSFPLGVFAAPTPNGPGIGSTWVGGGYGLNANSGNKDAALKFLNFIAAGEFGQILADELLQVPAAPSAKLSHPVVKELHSISIQRATPYLAVVYLNAGLPSGKKLLEDGLQAMFLGQMAPAEVAANIDKGISAWFGK